MCPLVSDPSYEGIKEASIKSMPDIVVAATRAGNSPGGSPDVARNIMIYIIKVLLEAIEDEDEIYLQITLLQSVKMCITSGCNMSIDPNEDAPPVYRSILTETEMQQITTSLNAVLQQCFQVAFSV